MHRGRHLDNVAERLRTSLWFTPTVMLGCTVALLTLLLRLDATIGDRVWPLDFAGDAEAARDVASTIAGATMGFIGIVFSITIVALQLASSQFSPRALRGFLRDRVTKATLGIFVSTLAYALLLIRAIDGDATEVPDLAISGLFLLTAGCIALFIVYIDRIAHSIRAVNILETITTEARRAIRHQHSPPAGHPLDEHAAAGFDDPGIGILHDLDGGVLVRVDRAGLARVAAACGGMVELLVKPGEYVRHGAEVARLHGVPAGTDVGGIRSALTFDVERTMQDDVAFGFRQLVDIALRALSPGVNDPTTAVQAIDRIGELLGLLASCGDPDPWVRDQEGVVRGRIPVVDWEDLVALAIDEIRIAGDGSLQVHRRLRSLLEELSEAVSSSRAAPIRDRLEALRRSDPDGFAVTGDRRIAAESDPTGIG